MTKARQEIKSLTVHSGPSDSHPGATSVTIFSPHRDEVEEVIVALYAEYGDKVKFVEPAKCADGGWGAYGRVWQ